MILSIPVHINVVTNIDNDSSYENYKYVMIVYSELVNPSRK
jgi:hypothetical protein